MSTPENLPDEQLGEVRLTVKVDPETIQRIANTDALAVHYRTSVDSRWRRPIPSLPFDPPDKRATSPLSPASDNSQPPQDVSSIYQDRPSSSG